jgi:hypothetical protein
MCFQECLFHVDSEAILSGEKSLNIPLYNILSLRSICVQSNTHFLITRRGVLTELNYCNLHVHLISDDRLISVLVFSEENVQNMYSGKMGRGYCSLFHNGAVIT